MSRTSHIGSTEELARLIEEVKGLAGRRASSLDFVGLYHDPSIQRGDAVSDVGRQVAAFQAYAEAGVTWMIVRADTQTPAEQTAFIEEFGRACIQ